METRAAGAWEAGERHGGAEEEKEAQTAGRAVYSGVGRGVRGRARRVRRPPGGARARRRSLPAAAPTAGAGGSAPAPANAAPSAEPATGGRAHRVGVGRAAPL